MRSPDGAANQAK
jgi:hypothetical protein